MKGRFRGLAVAAGLSLLTAGSASAQTQCGVILFFASGQNALSGAEQAALGSYISNNPGTYSVTGYTDSAGSEAANLALSQRRAENTAPVVSGVAGASVSRIAGLGEATRPGTTGPADPRNRRVEVIKNGCIGPGAPTGDATAMNPGLGIAAGIGALGVLAVAMSDDDTSGTGSTGSTGGTGAPAK